MPRTGRHVSRRTFLRMGAIGLTGAGLSSLLQACGGQPRSDSLAAATPISATPAPSLPPPTAPGAVVSAPTVLPARAPTLTVTDFPRVQSVSTAAAADGSIYVVFGKDKNLFVARSADGGRSFGTPVQVNPDAPALVLAVERPTIAAHTDGTLGAAWISVGDHRSDVRYAGSRDRAQSFGASVLVHQGGPHELAMVRMTLDEAGHPVVAWLEGGRLQLARSHDHGGVFPLDQVVDDQVCDCCQPHPLARNGRILVAYRNLEHDAQKGDIRDIYVTSSDDGGTTFGAPARVSDAHWYLNACPISGPALAADKQRVYVAWMDGRNDTSRAAQQSDIWLATSTDGGQSFSPNLRVNSVEGAYNNLPALAVDPAGRLHLGWEAQEQQREVLYYTSSRDGGRSFSEPHVIASSADGTRRGRPGNATLVVSEQGRAHMAWADGLGAHLASWEIRD